MRGLITALRTLTILPVPGKDAERMESSLVFFPFVGWFIGVLVSATAWLICGKYGWPSGAGIICVALVALLTGGLHLDGLADVFDSLGGRTTKRRLEIMKDSRIGSFGVIALVVVMGLQIASIARLSSAGNYWFMIVPFVVSRVVQVQLIVSLPYARAEGGMGKRFVEGGGMSNLVMAWVAGLLLCYAAAGFKGVLVVAIACSICPLLALWMRRMFGGVTGDLIGMGSELYETGILAAACFVI